MDGTTPEDPIIVGSRDDGCYMVWKGADRAERHRAWASTGATTWDERAFVIGDVAAAIRERMAR